MTNYELLKKLRELKIAVDIHGYDSLKVFYFGDDDMPEEAKPLIEELKNRKPEVLKLLEDPRPDLQEDSYLWQEVLLKAKQIGPDIHGSLHGFRGVGCTLEVKGDSLQMIPSDYWRSEASYREDRMEFLIPHKENIKQIFEEVAEEVINNQIGDVVGLQKVDNLNHDLGNLNNGIKNKLDDTIAEQF